MLKRSEVVANIEDEVWPTTSSPKVNGGREGFQSAFPIICLCVGERMYHFLHDCEMSLPWGLLRSYWFQQFKLPCHLSFVFIESPIILLEILEFSFPICLRGH